MSNGGSPSWNEFFPSGQLLAAIFALGVTGWYVGGSLDRSRPDVPARAAEVWVDPVRKQRASEVVPARLWEDPLAAAFAHLRRAAAAQANGGGLLAPLSDAIAPVLAVDDAQRYRILLVGTNGGRTPEDLELRLRYRYAVVSGLGASGYVPLNEDRLGYFLHAGHPVPYEWFRRTEGGGEGGGDAALVLWVDSRLLAARPAMVLASLLECALYSIEVELGSTESLAERISISALLTAGSGELIALERDWRREPPSVAFAATVHAVTATVPAALIQERVEAGLSPDLRERARPRPLAVGGGHELRAASAAGEEAIAWKVHRWICDDASLVHALCDEVRRRVRPTPEGPRVAIFTEWDTEYGRAWKELFAAELGERRAARAQHDAPRAVEDGGARASLAEPVARALDGESGRIDARGTSTNAAARVEEFVYLRGLDGRVGGDGAALEPVPGGDAKDEKARATATFAAGTERSDYVGRLVDRLMREREIGSFDAVCVLGSDVHDKLLLLSVLRPRMPGACFLTTDLDARFLAPGRHSNVRNLIVATPFGLELRPDLQGSIPPFRGSYQTSLFLATRLAVMPEETRNAVLQDLTTNVPLRFEIARAGLQELGLEGNRPNPVARSEQVLLRERIFGRHLFWWMAIAGCLFAVLYPFSRLLRRPLRGLADAVRGAGPAPREPVPRRLARWVLEFPGSARRSPGMTLYGIVVGVVILLLVVDQWRGGGEPLGILDGVSIWPSEFVRLLGAGIGVFAIRHIDRAFDREVGIVGDRLRLGAGDAKDAEEASAASRRLLAEAHPHLDPAEVPSLFRIYRVYRDRATARSRRWRVLLRVLLFYFAGHALLQLLGFPIVPARGAIARAADLVTVQYSVLVMLWLVFEVLDVAHVTERFIYLLGRFQPDLAAVAAPDRPAVLGFAREKIEVTTRLTERIGSWLYFPTCVIALLVVARLRVFDDWTWSPALVILVASSVLIMIAAYLLLCRAARWMKGEVLVTLGARLANSDTPDEVKHLDALIEEIEQLRSGAFGKPWQHPVMRAVLLPLLGFGGLGVLDKL